MHTGWKYQKQADLFDQLSPLAWAGIGAGLYLVGKGLIYLVSSPVVLLTTAA